jgi:diguanylate cyclase (GGDEF)-like protein
MAEGQPWRRSVLAPGGRRAKNMAPAVKVGGRSADARGPMEGNRDPRGLSAEVLTAIIAAQSAIGAESEPGDVMRVVCEHSQAITGADGATVELVDGEMMTYRAAAGRAAPHIGLKLRRDASLSGRCVAEARVLRCDDAETDPRVDIEACRRVGLRSMLVVPLVFKGKVVGVLKVLSPAQGHFNKEHEAVLQILAGFIASAIRIASALEDVQQRALHDGLTGLPNRVLFRDRLTQALRRLERSERALAIFFIDLDGFKPINDTCGHAAGDQLLIQVAARLRGLFRASDTVARVGGDEFLVLATDLTSRVAADALKDRIGDVMRVPFAMVAGEKQLGASVGTAFTRNGAVKVDDLIAQADEAMYAAKRATKRAAAAPAA